MERRPVSSSHDRDSVLGCVGLIFDTRQVEGQLDTIFRESPEFGRNLATRLALFLGENGCGPLSLIGDGGEAAVFFRSENALLSEATGMIHAIDFIVAGKDVG